MSTSRNSAIGTTVGIKPINTWEPCADHSVDMGHALAERFARYTARSRIAAEQGKEYLRRHRGIVVDDLDQFVRRVDYPARGRGIDPSLLLPIGKCDRSGCLVTDRIARTSKRAGTGITDGNPRTGRSRRGLVRRLVGRAEQLYVKALDPCEIKGVAELIDYRRQVHRRCSGPGNGQESVVSLVDLYGPCPEGPVGRIAGGIRLLTRRQTRRGLLRGTGTLDRRNRIADRIKGHHSPSPAWCQVCGPFKASWGTAPSPRSG